jgi:hypothetical protein
MIDPRPDFIAVLLLLGLVGIDWEIGIDDNQEINITSFKPNCPDSTQQLGRGRIYPCQMFE